MDRCVCGHRVFAAHILSRLNTVLSALQWPQVNAGCTTAHFGAHAQSQQPLSPSSQSFARFHRLLRLHGRVGSRPRPRRHRPHQHRFRRRAIRCFPQSFGSEFTICRLCQLSSESSYLITSSADGDRTMRDKERFVATICIP